MRADLCAKAVAAAKAVDYVGAGTVEFILDKDDGRFYFMEMCVPLGRASSWRNDADVHCGLVLQEYAAAS